MTKQDEAYHSILEAKYARIIAAMAEMHGLSFEESMDILYHSPLLPLIEDGGSADISGWHNHIQE